MSHLQVTDFFLIVSKVYIEDCVLLEFYSFLSLFSDGLGMGAYKEHHPALDPYCNVYVHVCVQTHTDACLLA